MTTTTRYSEEKTGERGYSWLHFSAGRAWIVSLLATLLGTAIAIGFYIWYIRTADDVAPDSTVGYVYAMLGTLCLLLAAVLYIRRRRSRNKRTVGQLHAALHWHICFATLGLILLFMHSFGNFNPRTGTYALYGMIALTISGFVGRILDRLLPRMIASEVDKALNQSGDDRIESISQKIESIVVHNTQQVRGFVPIPSPTSLVPLPDIPNPFRPSVETSKQLPHPPWDLAYISLEATPQELSNDTTQYRFIPDKKSGLTRPGGLMPGAQKQIAALQIVQQALQREQMYRYMIRYWRTFHIGLALLTLGLTIWHIVFAAQLLLPTLPLFRK